MLNQSTGILIAGGFKFDAVHDFSYEHNSETALASFLFYRLEFRLLVFQYIEPFAMVFDFKNQLIPGIGDFQSDLLLWITIMGVDNEV